MALQPVEVVIRKVRLNPFFSLHSFLMLSVTTYTRRNFYILLVMCSLIKCHSRTYRNGKRATSCAAKLVISFVDFFNKSLFAPY